MQTPSLLLSALWQASGWICRADLLLSDRLAEYESMLGASSHFIILEFNLPALVEGRREPTKHNPTHTNILNIFFLLLVLSLYQHFWHIIDNINYCFKYFFVITVNITQE